MERFFLTSKQWKVFLLFFVTFLLVIGLFYLVLTYSQDTIFTGFAMAIACSGSLSLLLSWYYFLNHGMNSKIQNKKLKSSSNGIWFFMIFPVLYMFLAFLIFPTGFLITTTEHLFNIWWIILIFPIHLFAVFSFFYVVYITARSIKIAESQEDVTFVDFAGEFFLLWFFPVGIWFLQPKINRIIGN
ncbi:hypothetical protein [Epilithonimonas mollis]|uniref:Uncharacterized protein n=1 Tax=Epilithonimonas mollis TaxID=216903 RepID=A0A1M6Q2M8_9FLAO|nr:hypothetical protein [Epilithonimonas mollis]SHK14453.1 hypothetical protein SAMN05444371_1476 [Epilithonimonas mollis]